MPPGRIAQLVGKLDGRVGASAGARTVPSDATVARSGIAATISGDVSGSVQQAAQSLPTTPVQTVSVRTLQSSANVGTVQSQGSSVVEQAYTSPTASGTIFGAPSSNNSTVVTTTNITSNAQLASPNPPIGGLAGPDILPRPPTNQTGVSVLGVRAPAR
jgi:hypothetical protein